MHWWPGIPGALQNVPGKKQLKGFSFLFQTSDMIKV
jgi:hypothetical protein